jgi:hypothetical protein
MNIMSSWILFQCYQCEVRDCDKFPALHVVLLKITAPIEEHASPTEDQAQPGHHHSLTCKALAFIKPLERYK